MYTLRSLSVIHHIWENACLTHQSRLLLFISTGHDCIINARPDPAVPRVKKYHAVPLPAFPKPSRLPLLISSLVRSWCHPRRSLVSPDCSREVPEAEYLAEYLVRSPFEASAVCRRLSTMRTQAAGGTSRRQFCHGADGDDMEMNRFMMYLFFLVTVGEYSLMWEPGGSLIFLVSCVKRFRL
jgi:hypothetical protein